MYILIEKSGLNKKYLLISSPALDLNNSVGLDEKCLNI